TALTATLPKFIFAVFVIPIGPTIVAVAVAVADTCANVAAVKAIRIIAKEISFFMFFILKFLLLIIVLFFS
ncbi:MAG TPA: hypothetical protein DCZ51_10730, partial [Bacteroidales bacterium]|nr:hypothetical protein [Bacteroidales bacterium]